jgi:hypothetical protein
MLASTVRRPSRLALLAAGGLAAGAMALGAGATTAVASAEGCTYTDVPYAYVCGQVHGEKLHVETVDVSRGKFPGGTIKDYHAEVTVRSPGGGFWWFRSGTHEGKTYTRAYMTVDIHRSFPDGSKLCGTFFEGGDAQDTVCFRIHD